MKYSSCYVFLSVYLSSLFSRDHVCLAIVDSPPGVFLHRSCRLSNNILKFLDISQQEKIFG